MEGFTLKHLSTHTLFFAVPASFLPALGWPAIGITPGASSLAAGVPDARLKSTLPLIGPERQLTTRGIGGNPPLAGVDSPRFGSRQAGPTGPTGFPQGLPCGVCGPCFVGEFNGVSCATATSCTAVGEGPGGTLAEGWNGTSWSIQAAPTPATGGSLRAVSCPAANACLAVGYDASDAPLAESSNGSSWTIRPPPSPAGATSTAFSYVQCASASACMVVGSYYDSSSGDVLPLVELWGGGSSWTIQTVPLPAGASDGALSGVSCPSTNARTAVGADQVTSTSPELPLAEAWNGSSWSPTPHQPQPPATATFGPLNAVWCFAGTSCTAVGQSNNSGGGGTSTLAEGWDGTNWTIQATNNPTLSTYNSFANLSCDPSAAGPPGAPCQAVGSSDSGPLVESWDGTNWSQPESTPSPAGSTLRDVSCTAANACTAVGSYLGTSTFGGFGATSTLAERWDGTNWSGQPTPNAALFAVGGATNLGSSSATLNATVYPEGATVTSCYFDYGPTTAYGSTVPCAQSVGGGYSPVAVSADLSGLTPNTTYYFDIVAANAAGGVNGEPFASASFTTSSGGSGPTVTTGSPANVTSSSATLNGSVNPSGTAVTSCYFEYGPTTVYGSRMPCAQSVGGGTSPVAVSAPLHGLASGTTYHFRLIATAAGAAAGQDATFTTVPSPQSRYVAMGDSYSSGEGTASYDNGTDTSTDNCHRSSHDLNKASYPPLLVRDSPYVPSTLTFVACSGAKIDDVRNGKNGEPSQLKALGSDVSLVTISVGGDDLGFAGVLNNCVNEGPFHFRSDDTCQGQEQQIHQIMYVGDPAHGIPPLSDRLIQLYQDIRARVAPNARILVMGYPHLFPLTGDNSCGSPGLRYMDSSDINWLNKIATEVDGYLAASVAESGVAQYVSTFNAMTDASGNDHSACGDNAPWINELQLFHPAPWSYSNESFHPNPEGYIAFEREMLGAISGGPPGITLLLNSGQTLNQALTVGTPLATLTVSASWPGSTVTTSLVSPAGRVIDATTKAPDVRHVAGPTYEAYTVTRPSHGTWHVRIVGTSISQGGELVRIDTPLVKPRRIPPLARLSIHQRGGRARLAVVFSARGSRALEGRIARVLWDFGDGSHGRGRRIVHTYKHSGRYAALLTIIDTAGASTYASATVLVGPTARVRPSHPVNLGSAKIGRHAHNHVFTVTNLGPGSFVVRRIVAVAGATNDVRLFSSRCARRLLTGRHSCTFKATLAPSALGLRWAKVAIIANTGPVGYALLYANGT